MNSPAAYDHHLAREFSRLERMLQIFMSLLEAGLRITNQKVVTVLVTNSSGLVTPTTSVVILMQKFI